MADSNLVTISTFKGREYLVKMNIVNNNLIDIIINDKYTGEEWQCSYDATYIENLTHRTGNFKQFNIFTAMLRSGLLKTSDCVTLDLLTFEDLEILRSRRGKPFHPPGLSNNTKLNTNNNRRYLILTYSVEFDRIHYPLPLDYCGPPDPQMLQANIRRLESEIARLHEQIAENEQTSPTTQLQRRISELVAENNQLNEELKILRCSKTPSNQIHFLHDAIKTLEESVINERNSHNRLVKQLKDENDTLKHRITILTEKLQSHLDTTSISKKKFPYPNGLVHNRLSDPQVDLIFLNNNPPASSRTYVDAGDGKQFQSRLTSLLPQISQIESWEATLRRQNIRNRSTSRGSRRERDRMISDTNQTARKSRKLRKHRSRSGSASSHRSRRTSSTGSNNSQTPAPSRLRHIESHTMYQRMKVNSSMRNINSVSQQEIDYNHLQNRIQDLQKLLANNLKL